MRKDDSSIEEESELSANEEEEEKVKKPCLSIQPELEIQLLPEQ